MVERYSIGIAMIFYLRGTVMKSFPYENIRVSMLATYDDSTGYESSCDIGTCFDITNSVTKFREYSDTFGAKGFSVWLERILT
jgi:hypothetical protein